jgi:hypothetical protein
VRSAVLAAAAVMFACNQVDLCSWRVESVTSGGAKVACLTGDDCPRDGNAVVCDRTGAPDRTCVRCAQGACERVVAVRCSP